MPTASARVTTTAAQPLTPAELEEPSAAISVITSPVTVAVSTTSTTAPGSGCPPIEVLVVGNSTDYTPVTSDTIAAPSDDAWPTVAAQLIVASAPQLDVVVTNSSVRGAGTDVAMLLATSMRAHVVELAEQPTERVRLAVLLPSLIDLQLKDLDVDRSFAAFVELLDDATGWFDAVAVTPMHPVAGGLDPDLSEAIAEFNARLTEEGLLTAPWATSPLLEAGTMLGALEYFDDFDDLALGTPGPDPDGLHPDRDGHRRLAEVAAPWLLERIRPLCAT